MMSARQIATGALLLLATTACGGARARREEARGPKHEIQLVNTCNVEMRVYVDDDIKMRGNALDMSTILPTGARSVKKLYSGSHRIVMVPHERRGEARQITLDVRGPARVRICQ
jgi:hypothetical protein